jgi:hypothetical protein
MLRCLALSKRALMFSAARTAGPCPCLWVDPEVGTRQWMPMLAVGPGCKGHVFGVRHNHEVVRIPANMDAAAVMQLHVVRDWAP